MVTNVDYDVVARLHQMVASSPPGSERAEIAEYGIGLALSPRRPAKAGPLMLHDVWRNAAHNYRRADRRRRALANRLTAFAPAGGVPATTGRTNQRDDPAAIVEAADLEARIRRIAQTIPHGLRCLDGLLDGETAGETAVAAGISPRTVHRTRDQLRAATRRLLLDE
jgi:DNA-directed RNA polymerase specialized sigma24 family protein